LLSSSTAAGRNGNTSIRRALLSGGEWRVEIGDLLPSPFFTFSLWIELFFFVSCYYLLLIRHRLVGKMKSRGSSFNCEVSHIFALQQIRFATVLPILQQSIFDFSFSFPFYCVRILLLDSHI
jgi:hypothetical protein